MKSNSTLRRSIFAALIGLATQASADDWGYYSIIPVSAPAMVLEAPEGVPVTIGKPTGAANQKWIIQPKG